MEYFHLPEIVVFLALGGSRWKPKKRHEYFIIFEVGSVDSFSGRRERILITVKVFKMR